MRPKGSAAELEARRQRALDLLEAGLGVVAVARQTGVSRVSVGKWNKAGRIGVRAKPRPQRSRKLKAAQLTQLRRLILAGPVACGFSTDLWTCPRIAQVIRERFGVSYHVDHLSRLLRDLGFSAQKPKRRAAERDEKAIAHWVMHDWPRIKKKRAD
jgi:transposase